MMPALDPSTSALNRKQHTEAERQETSNDTRAASAFTSKRPKRNQTSSITKRKPDRTYAWSGFPYRATRCAKRRLSAAPFNPD